MGLFKKFQKILFIVLQNARQRPIQAVNIHNVDRPRLGYIFYKIVPIVPIGTPKHSSSKKQNDTAISLIHLETLYLITSRVFICTAIGGFPTSSR